MKKSLLFLFLLLTSVCQFDAFSADNVKTWREDLGYGGFVIVKQYANGTQYRTRYRLCPNCRGAMTCMNCFGRGVCAICNGQGYIVSAGYGSYIPCAACNYTGRCAICNGTGKCICTANGNQYPGYVIGSTATILPDGSTSRETADYSNGRSKSSSSSSSGKTTCPDCGGTRLWHKGKQPEYARPRSELVGYYNASGSKCPYCGYYTEHWHSTCTTCKHYSGTTNPYR